MGAAGHALLILRPEELGFLRYLKHAKVPLNEFEFSWSKIADIQLQVGYQAYLVLITFLFLLWYPLLVNVVRLKSSVFYLI